MRLFAALACCLLAACSTTPISLEEAAPPTAVLAPDLLTAAPGTGAVVILRDRGMSGSGCLHQVKVDGRHVATLDNSEGVTLHLPPGQHVLSVDFGRGLCPNVALSAEPNVQSGGRIVYRISLAADGATRLTRVE
jgi:hypothetical protein